MPRFCGGLGEGGTVNLERGGERGVVCFTYSEWYVYDEEEGVLGRVGELGDVIQGGEREGGGVMV
jgi:hypothetical protein